MSGFLSLIVISCSCRGPIFSDMMNSSLAERRDFEHILRSSIDTIWREKNQIFGKVLLSEPNSLYRSAHEVNVFISSVKV